MAEARDAPTLWRPYAIFFQTYITSNIFAVHPSEFHLV